MNRSTWHLFKGFNALFIVFVLAFPVIAQNTHDPLRTISLSETASVEAEANVALISLDVLIEGRETQELEEETYQRSKRIIEIFKKYEVNEDDFQTTNNSVYDSQRDKKYLKTVQLGYELKFRKLERIDDLRKDLIGAGVSRFRITSFENTEAEKYARLASELALKKAMENAAVLAKVANMKLGDPTSINVNKQYIQPQVRRSNQMMAEALMVQDSRVDEPAIHRTKVQYQASINVTFELYKK